MLLVNGLSTFKKMAGLIAFTSLLTLSACSDDNNSNNNTEPTPPPPVEQKPETVSSAEHLNVALSVPQITNNKLSIIFNVTNAEDIPVVGISSVRFTITKLTPGTNGDVSHWQSYINRIKDESETFPGTVAAVQAANEGDGELVDNQNGSYLYTFANDILSATNPLTGEPIPWEENLTHRVAIEVRGSDNNPPQNSAIDFIPSGAEVTMTRDIVAIESCNQCHTELALHGGNRIDTAYCVTCHNEGSSEPISGESLDFKTMVHKIHRGANLPGIKAQGDGAKYSIFGFRNSEHIYAENVAGQVNGVHFPQNIADCTNCHIGEMDKLEQPDSLTTVTADGDNWKTYPTVEACGSCHDNIAFNETMFAANTGMIKHEAAFPASNTDCSTCHGIGQSQEIAQFHTEPIDKNGLAAKTISFASKSIALGTGLFPTIDVTIHITKDDMPVSELSQVTPYMWSSAYVLVNWDDGTGYQAAYDPFGNIAPADNQVHLDDCTAGEIVGDFICSWSTKDLNSANDLDFGTLAVTFADVSVCIDKDSHQLTNCPITGNNIVRLPAMVSKQFYDLTSLAMSSTYDEKVGADIESCNTCHGELAVHMEATNTHAATDFAQCTSCHNATRVAYYTGRPGDLKFQVHKMHANNAFADGGHGVHYPSPLNECGQCHKPEQIQLPLQQNNRASFTTTTGIFDQRVYTSPTAVVCTSCHLRVSPGLITSSGELLTNAGEPILDNEGNAYQVSIDEKNLITHMINIGNATFGAKTAIEAENSETCADCHAIGMQVGVDVKHQ